MKDVMIIANPSSGKKKAEEYAKDMREAFLKHDREAEIKITEKKEDISQFGLAASKEKFRTIIVIGGDGTVSELVNGLGKRQHRPEIGIIPSGTVNNIARGLNIPSNPSKIIDEIPLYQLKKIDAGRVNDRLFLSSVSAGPLPETVWEVSDEQKEMYGQAAYFIEGVRSLNDEDTYKVGLEIDEEHKAIDLNLLLIGVGRSIAGIPNFFNEAENNDGKLYLFGLKRSSLRQKLTVLQALLFSNETFNDSQDIAFSVPFEKAVLTIENKKTYTTVDGDQGPSFPIIVEVLPQFLSVLVPEE